MARIRKKFENYVVPNKKINLPAKAGLQESNHIFEQSVVDAILTAKAINRPLLVKGEPGLGKSQIAHAIASCMEWNLITLVVHHKTQPTDLLYRVDHLKRLALAQLYGAMGNTSDLASGDKQNDEKAATASADALEEKHFVVPGPLWWAYNPVKAREFYDTSLHGYTSAFVHEIEENKPSVLLIDEIDKADRDLPNTLLEVLNNQTFHIPSSDQTVEVESTLAPFVIVTSNSERALPDAFLRRCVVLTLTLADGEEGQKHLMDIAQVHFQKNEVINKDLIQKAAELLIRERSKKAEDEYKPGVSEYLDLLRALAAPEFNKHAERLQALDKVSQYILHK